MNFGYYRFAPVAVFDPATVAVDLDDASISTSDFSGTVTRAAGRIAFRRAIVDGQGFEHCAPGARVRFKVSLAATGEVALDLRFTGLVTRTDTYRPTGAILVNGAIFRAFSGSPKLPYAPHPVETIAATLTLPAGTHTIEVTLPYCASMEVTGLRVPVGTTLAAASPRPNNKACFAGDSIVHGFNGSSPVTGWVWQLAATKNWQMINLGYGGRTIEAPDASIAGAVLADRTITEVGINNCFAGSSASAIQAAAEAYISAHRTAAASVGQATKPLYWINLFDCTSSLLVTAPATARSAISAAFSAVGGAYDFLIAGGTANGLPSATTFSDLVHPDDDEMGTIASVLAGLIA